MTSVGINNSLLATYRTCKRKAYFQYIHAPPSNRVGARSHQIAFGSVAHLAIEAFWKAKTHKNPDCSPWKAALSVVGKNSEGISGERLVVCEELVKKYVRYWEPTPWISLLTEYKFQLPLVGYSQRELFGTFDAVIFNPETEEVAILEHKTTSADLLHEESSYRQSLLLNTQVSHYLYAGRKLFGETTRLIYDVIQKPRVKMKVGETEEEFRARLVNHLSDNPPIQSFEVVRTQQQIDRWFDDMLDTVEEINRSEISNSWPATPEKCFDYNSRCQFFGICKDSDSELIPVSALSRARRTAGTTLPQP